MTTEMAKAGVQPALAAVKRPASTVAGESDVVYTAPKPDHLGKWRRRVMREMKREPAYWSWHPAQKKKMRHLVMRHLNPERGFMMRQGKFAEELGVRREKVNNFLRQAVERELLTPPRGSRLTESWRGANTYFVHPRILEKAHTPAHRGAQQGAQHEVTQGKLRKGSSALAEASAAEKTTRSTASTDVPAVDGPDDTALRKWQDAAADDWLKEQAETEEWEDEPLSVIPADSLVHAYSTTPPVREIPF